MKRIKNIRMKAKVCILLGLTFILAMSFAPTVVVYAAFDDFEVRQKKSPSSREQSLRLLSVLEDKIATISNSQNTISELKIVHGFNGDTYVVVECEPMGYMIYHNASGTFVETSLKSISPYSGLSGEGLYYCGPTHYYQFVKTKLFHTVLGYAVDDERTVDLLDRSQLVSDSLNSAPDKPILDFLEKGNSAGLMASKNRPSVSGSIGSDGYAWFSSLQKCGYIPGGHCGFIALNMLYGYLDRFSDDKYIPNTYWTDPTKSSLKDKSDSFAQALYDLDPKNGTTSMHIHKVSKQYLKNNNIKNIDHTSRWFPFWKNEDVSSIIDKGYPVIIFGRLDNQENTKTSASKGNHAVVAYAYNRSVKNNSIESFVVHYGWNGFREITVVDNAANLFGSIYAMEVNDGHIHNFEDTPNFMIEEGEIYGVEKCTTCGVAEPIDAFKTTVINGGTIRIDKFLPQSFTGEIDIPDKINGQMVTQIGAFAFANSSVSKITIPSGVISIGNNAFSNTPNLLDVLIPKTVNNIDYCAFLGANINLKINFIGRMSLERLNLHEKWNTNGSRILFDGVDCNHAYSLINGKLVCLDCNHTKTTDGHSHFFRSINGHFYKCMCGEFESICESTIEIVGHEEGHGITCCTASFFEEHSYIYHGDDGYRCALSGCNWVDLDHPHIIKTSDYKYQQQYYFDEKEATIYPQNGPNFTTKRLRTGIIEGHLVMSAKRINAGTAYHIYNFDYNVCKINYQLALWSSSEGLNQNASIRLEAFVNDKWVITRTFQASAMGQNKNNLMDYSDNFNMPVSTFRFIVETSDATNENNKGRVVIGTVEVFETSEDTFILLDPVKTAGKARLIYNPNFVTVSVVVRFMDENNQPNEHYRTLNAGESFTVPDYCFIWPTYTYVRFYYQGYTSEVSIWYLEEYNNDN